MTIYSIIYLAGTILLIFAVQKTIRFGKKEFVLKQEKEKWEKEISEERSQVWKQEPELQESIRQRKKFLKVTLVALGVMYLSITFISFI